MSGPADLPFAEAVREELWIAGRLFERHLSHGHAVISGGRLIASDDADPALLESSARLLEGARHRLGDLLASDGPRLRLIASARLDESSCTVTIRRDFASIVTTPEDAVNDDEMLRNVLSTRVNGEMTRYRGVPIVWKNGSASVLLHEAAGHAAEHSAPPIRWPGWLEVSDQRVDLLHGSAPPAWRRASFRDVPLRRMTSLEVRQRSAPIAESDYRIEVLLLAGGSYEPLTGEVTVSVAAADLVEGGRVTRLAPFVLRESREAVAAALAGAAGEPVRYPGVVCSREGQELVVGSSAPEIVTAFS